MSMSKTMAATALLLGLTLAACSGQGATSNASTASSADRAVSATAAVATSADMAEPVELDLAGLTPIAASALREGSYPIDCACSSSMFKIDSCELVVADGGMKVRLTMGSSSFPYLYQGTAEQAAAASEADYLVPEDVDGAPVFTLAVDALDAPVNCAAYSKKKELWYDRTLVFRADSLPAEAFVEARGTTVESLGLADGSYTAAVALTGGSGKASVTSPAEIVVADGKATARIEWSSSNYDYMVVDGVRLEPVNTDGNSVFEMPVAAFDTQLTVLADTTAMSTPHEIEYGLTFDSSTLASA